MPFQGSRQTSSIWYAAPVPTGRWDGTGYPDGLARGEIPLVARIVACCDAFNAMTSDRSYRAAMPLDEAVAELRRGSGTQFDPGVVDALIATLGLPRERVVQGRVREAVGAVADR